MSAADQQTVANAIHELPELLQDTVSRGLQRIDAIERGDEIPTDMLATLPRVLACSDFAASTVQKEWRWLLREWQHFHVPPDAAELDKFVRQIGASDAPIDQIKQQLRQYRHRYMLQVLWREIEGVATLRETLLALSDLADRFLEAAAAYAERQMLERYGVLRDENGDAVSIVVLGMGKLGGRELNFSSDIDLIFLYPAGEHSDGTRQLSAPEYFTRVSQLIVALLDEVTGDGFAFRIDTRLRPFGDSGPPVVSFAALESYLLRHGRGWERYAYVKARIVGPVPPVSVVEDLYVDLITPFVYRRYLDFGVFESLRDMQSLIAVEVRRRDLADNVKLGPGGIREIEFIAQSLQLVRGGSRPELQQRELQTVLPKLVGRQGMQQDDVDALLDAYGFLRRIENFIQAIRDQQTHELPSGDVDRARLCLAMRYPDWAALRKDLDRHRHNVSRQFDKIAFRERGEDTDNRLRDVLTEQWGRSVAADDWRRILEDEGFSRADELAKALEAFGSGSMMQHIDATARRRLRPFIANLLLLIKDIVEPSIALQRTLAIAEKVLRRSAYLSLLNENNPAMSRLVSLCEQSAYIAEQIARYPVLLDELLDPRIYSEGISCEGLDDDLRQRLAAWSAADSEAQMEVLGQFQRASQFRIAVADFNGSLPIMRVSDCLTDLAETVLNHALQVAWADMTAKYGEPEYIVDGESHKAGFGIIAYGKLGGLELSYGSDLDLVFLHDSSGSAQMTNSEQALDNTMFYTRLVRRLVLFLTTQTDSGVLYEIDTRLRPDGQSGLLVTSVDAFERYQEANAWTWEHQALLRARPVAGSDGIAREFVRIRNDTLTTRVRRDTLRHDVLSMRRRMRKKLDQSDQQQFDLKQGSGGIGDLEFIVQYLVLLNAVDTPAVIQYSDNIRQLDALAATACLQPKQATQLQDIYRAYRLRLHHLLLDQGSQLVAQNEFVAEREAINGLWQSHLVGTE